MSMLCIYSVHWLRTGATRRADIVMVGRRRVRNKGIHATYATFHLAQRTVSTTISNLFSHLPPHTKTVN